MILFRLVRDQAFKAMQLFVKKLEEHAATMVSQSYLVGLIPRLSFVIAGNC